MPLSISSDAIVEKNKLASGDSWLLLLEFNYPEEDPLYLVWNTENIVWDTKTWLAFPFALGDEEETKESTVPTVDLVVVDVERKLIPILDDHSGGIGAEVTVRVVHSAYLENDTPEYEAIYEIVDVSIGHKFDIHFKLGSENLAYYRSPPSLFLKHHCRYKDFKGSKCGYAGGETDCDRTWEECGDLGNRSRFGGFPAIGGTGIYG